MAKTKIKNTGSELFKKAISRITPTERKKNVSIIKKYSEKVSKGDLEGVSLPEFMDEQYGKIGTKKRDNVDKSVSLIIKNGLRRKKIKPVKAKKLTPFKIKSLLNERDFIYRIDNESKKVDDIQKTISEAIRYNFNEYDVDFIIETWTRFGSSLSVIYDDNGFFAVTGDGVQQAVYGKQRIEGNFTVYVRKHQWKKTIREALELFIMGG
jgi:hypothetical protein